MQTALLDNENVHSYLLNTLNINNYYSDKQTNNQTTHNNSRQQSQVNQHQLVNYLVPFSDQSTNTIKVHWRNPESPNMIMSKQTIHFNHKLCISRKFLMIPPRTHVFQ